MSVQSTYQENLDVAREGMIAGSDFEVVTGIQEDATAIEFGRAVAQGSADAGVTLGGTTTTFKGVTVRDVALGSENDNYDQYANVGVLRRGQIWLKPTHAVSPGDAVYFTAATGKFTNQSGGNVLVKGARWETAAAVADSDLAIAYFSGLQRGVDA